MRPLATFLITPFGGFVGACTQASEGHAISHSVFRQRAGAGRGRADLMNYLLFTPKYTRELIEIGYNDANRRIDEIEDFLYPSSSANERSADIPRPKPAT